VQPNTGAQGGDLRPRADDRRKIAAACLRGSFAATPVVEAGLRRTATFSSRRDQREVAILLVLLALAVMLSGISPRDRLTWVLEEAPVFIGVPILIATWRRFPLTLLAYRLIFIHALLLTFGAHYTFSEVPLGLWLRDVLGIARNNYDRVVHFVGGVAPAILGREILRRKTPLGPGGWLFFLVALGCLGGSAFYELLEWWAAAITGAQASAFLATQGDLWDTQWDMFLGLAGAVVGQLVFGRLHERELARSAGRL
jgi:putative membrane protein